MSVGGWQLFDIRDYPGDLWRDWQDLVVGQHRRNPMLDAAFARLLVEHFGTEVHVLVNRQRGPAAVLALVESVGAGRWQSFRPSQAQAALIVLEQQHAFDPVKLIRALPGHCFRFDLFALDPREHAPFLAPSNQVHQVASVRNICVETNGDFDRYWEQRPRNLRKNLRRYRSRLSDEVGELRLEIASEPIDVAAATDRYGMVEARGWKGQIGTALHPGNRQGQFYRSFMTEMAEQQRAFVFELYADDILLATRLCVTGDGVLVILKTTFDEGYRRYAVGRLLLQEVLQFLFRHQSVELVDFYTDATKEQMDWATTDRSMLHASIYRSTTARRLYGFGKSLVHILKNRGSKVR